MDDLYDEVFDLREIPNNEDIYYHQIIPTINIEIYKKALEKNIKIINNSQVSIQKWLQFKCDLLEYEEQWQKKVFIWAPKNIYKEQPYISIDVDFYELANKSTRYFQVAMALEDCWMGENLCNIWKRIDCAIEDKK